jgi:hypothetical protein
MGLLPGCYYDNVEDLYPQTPACDTSNVTYSETIAPIMNNHCNSCHPTGGGAGGIVTDNWNDLSAAAANGVLWGAVNHEQGYEPMPLNAPKLGDCNLKKIKTWIDTGAPNN